MKSYLTIIGFFVLLVFYNCQRVDEVRIESDGKDWKKLDISLSIKISGYNWSGYCDKSYLYIRNNSGIFKIDSNNTLIDEKKSSWIVGVAGSKPVLTQDYYLITQQPSSIEFDPYFPNAGIGLYNTKNYEEQVGALQMKEFELNKSWGVKSILFADRLSLINSNKTSLLVTNQLRSNNSIDSVSLILLDKSSDKFRVSQRIPVLQELSNINCFYAYKEKYIVSSAKTEKTYLLSQNGGCKKILDESYIYVFQKNDTVFAYNQYGKNNNAIYFSKDGEHWESYQFSQKNSIYLTNSTVIANQLIDYGGGSIKSFDIRTGKYVELSTKGLTESVDFLIEFRDNIYAITGFNHIFVKSKNNFFLKEQ